MMIENNDLVTIIIPTYKRSNLVCRAVESALKQNYENIEIIVVDDNEEGSEEMKKTQENLKSYITSNNIRYVKNDFSKGGAGARNKGIKLASGEFIAFLDDDDEYFPEKILKQYKYFKSKKATNPNLALIYCHSIVVNENKKKIGEHKNHISGNALYESMKACIANSSFWFMPKDILIKVGGFSETISKQDNMTIIKILAAGYEVDFVEEALVYYYDYLGEKISTNPNKAINGFINLRNYSRTLYYKLKNKKQIEDVEINFSKQLFNLYLVNDRKLDARKELKLMIKCNILDKRSLISLLKYILKPFYIIFLNLNSKRRFN